MVCGRGVPSLRSLWGAVWNQQLYTLQKRPKPLCTHLCNAKNCIQYGFLSVPFLKNYRTTNYRTLLQQKIKQPYKEKTTSSDNFFHMSYIFHRPCARQVPSRTRCTGGAGNHPVAPVSPVRRTAKTPTTNLGATATAASISHSAHAASHFGQSQRIWASSSWAVP